MKEDIQSCPITPIPKQIGPYKILKKIASGGMGEVFLAQDPFCKRSLALKKIREDRMKVPGFKERFLKEVKIAAQLSHPSIVPIYQIHQTPDEIYYTMPLVEGETLKEILRTTLHQEKQGILSHPIGSSIPALMRIFLNICQAVAYSHSKGILHRDLKPENIIIGKYGEVFILDWGLADFAGSAQEEIEIDDRGFEVENFDLTRPGKVAGTLSYLPPERIFGVKASYSSDIYALGVILYQLLTLRLPFRHTSVKEYKKKMKHTVLIDPAERSPYREIPPQLSKIAKKCLALHHEKRYRTIQEILTDLNNYIEGHAQWSPCATIQVDHKDDWAFQENILLAKQIALTQKSDLMEWVNLMMSKQALPGNIKFETHIRIKSQGSGIGFLLTMNSIEEKKDFFQEGFFLWIGSDQNPGSSLFRSNVEVMSTPDFYLKEKMSHFIRIEKTDNHLRFYLDNILAFDYLSHIPLNIPRFGIVLRDNELEIGSILISSSSPNIMVNCLAVPDAFLAQGLFKQALLEYRQIGKSFLGRAEGREAIFRAGITLLEEAQLKKKNKEREKLFKLSLEEFGLLRNTPGAPLEYLGKSLVYKANQELEEEMKCLELSLCKFAKHPLISLIKDQILFRLHEASYKDRNAAYHLALLTLRYMPEAFFKPDNQILLQNLKKNAHAIPFLFLQEVPVILQLAFQLYKPYVICDLFEELEPIEEKIACLFCLAYLGFSKKVSNLVEKIPKGSLAQKAMETICIDAPEALNSYFDDPRVFAKNSFMKSSFLIISDPFQSTSPSSQSKILSLLEKMATWDLPLEETFLILNKLIEWFLYTGQIDKAETYLKQIPQAYQENEDSAFYFLKTCLIAGKNGIEFAKKRLSRHEADRPSPVSLIDAYLNISPSEKKEMEKQAFFWEKKELLKNLILFYRSGGKEKEASFYEKKLTKHVKTARSGYTL